MFISGIIVWILKQVQGLNVLIIHFQCILVVITHSCPQAILEMWKFDIEKSDLEVLNQVVRSGILRQVKQVAFELHMQTLRSVGAGLFQWTYEILLELERQGFRKFRSHQNWHGKSVNSRSGRSDGGCCFEVYYINLKFLTHSWHMWRHITASHFPGTWLFLKRRRQFNTKETIP